MGFYLLGVVIIAFAIFDVFLVGAWLFWRLCGKS